MVDAEINNSKHLTGIVTVLKNRSYLVHINA
jgi:hypothetical protein